VGIAPAKTLAKLANESAKSTKAFHGYRFVNEPDDIEKMLMQTPVHNIWGVGRNYAAMLAREKIKTALMSCHI
jgi:DNA polymerase V